MLLPSSPTPKSAIRKQIFGDRPLAPMQYPVAVYKPRRSWWIIIKYVAAGLSYLALADIVVGYFLR